MNKLVLSAAALALTSTGLASDEDWSAFDSAYAKEVEALASSVSADSDGAKLSGYIQTLYTNNSDTDPKTSGFSVPRARVILKGSREGYGYKLQYDTAADADSRLKDAYIDIPIGGAQNGESTIKGRMGLFKPWVSRNGLTSSSKLFFIDRSAIGDLYDNRGAGFALNGMFDALEWAVTVQNGEDGLADDYLTALRVAFTFMGEGAGEVEGAYMGPSGMTGTAAVAYVDDGGAGGGNDDVETLLLEAHIASNLYSFGVEFLDAGTDGAASNATNGAAFADASPITVYGTYMLVEDLWELGVRYQDLDQAVGDYTIIDLGVNHYVDGHGLKWSFGYTQVERDAAGPISEIDDGIIRLGLQVAF